MRDLTNQRFGKLLVLHLDPEKPKKRSSTRWIVKCDCGKVYSSSLDSLCHKGVTQCKQCADNFVDLTGQQFGKLTVINRSSDYVSPSGRSVVRWLTKCSCGNVTSVMSGHLTSGSSTKCRACATDNQKLNGRMSSRAIQKIKRGAQVRRIKLELDNNYLTKLMESQGGKCAISGVDIGFADTIVSSKRGGDTASLDRIDSSIGYVEGNVQWVHKTVNIMKQRMTNSQLIDWCIIIAEHSKKQALHPV